MKRVHDQNVIKNENKNKNLMSHGIALSDAFVSCVKRKGKANTSLKELIPLPSGKAVYDITPLFSMIVLPLHKTMYPSTKFF